MVADHAQLVVQIVLTTSSNTVGLWTMRPAPAVTHDEVGIGGRGLVERREVGVEPQDVTDRRGELGRRAFGRRRAEDRDLRVTLAPRLDPDRPRASATGA